MFLLYYTSQTRYVASNVRRLDTNKTHVLGVVDLTTRVKHVNMKWHLPLATGNASRTRVSAEARTSAEISRPAATGKAYAATVKVYTTNIAIQTDLTRTNGKKKYTKIADIEKNNETNC